VPSFFLLMLIASGFGLAKLVVLAKVLEPAAFGEFVTLLGAGALSGVLLSFGTVEATVKTYPRLWALGRAQEIRASARAAATKLAVRFAVLGGLAAAAGAFGLLPYGAPALLLTSVIGLATAYMSLMTSVMRAADRSAAVRDLTLARNAFALVLAIAAGWLFSWEAALLGEAAGAVAAILIVLRDARGVLDTPTARTDSAETTPLRVETTSWRLYFAYLLSAAIALGDRAAVNAAAGPAAAGAYGVVAIVFQGGQILTNILVQRIGGIVIKGRADDGAPPPALSSLLAAAGISAAAAVVVLLGVQATGFPAAIWDRYAISPLALVLAGAIAGLQIFSIVEFHLLARDAEARVLAASGLAAVTAAAGFSISAVIDGPLEAYIGSVLAARLAQLVVLLLAMSGDSGKASGRRSGA
jgi:O-antigen/teichoic acid export membrane protein